MASFPVCQGGHPGLECSRFEQALLPPVSIVLGGAPLPLISKLQVPVWEATLRGSRRPRLPWEV